MTSQEIKTAVKSLVSKIKKQENTPYVELFKHGEVKIKRTIEPSAIDSTRTQIWAELHNNGYVNKFRNWRLGVREQEIILTYWC